MRRGWSIAGAVLLWILTVGTGLIALLAASSLLSRDASAGNDSVAWVQLELFSVWAVLATALLIAGVIRWRRGARSQGVAAAWFATPLWSIGFGLVFIALAMTVLVSIAAAGSRVPRARIAA